VVRFAEEAIRSYELRASPCAAFSAIQAACLDPDLSEYLKIVVMLTGTRANKKL